MQLDWRQHTDRSRRMTIAAHEPTAVPAAELALLYAHILSPTPEGAVTELELLYDAGFECFARGDLEGAIAALEQVLEKEPGHVPALRTIAMACHRLGQHAEALAYGQRHVDADPNDVMAHSSLSLFLMKLGRVKDAEAVAATAKKMTWKRQIQDAKKGVTETPGLNIVETAAPKPIFETAPQMPLGIPAPRRPTDSPPAQGPATASQRPSEPPAD